MVQFRYVLMGLWLVGIAAAIAYAHQQHIPPKIAIPVGLAFLIELTFFAGLGRFRWTSPWAVIASGLIPYLVYSIPTGVFRPAQFLELACLAGILGFWLRATRGRPWADWIFLLYAAAVILSGVLNNIFADVEGISKMETLGRIMWFRLAMTCVLMERGSENMRFGFIPNRAEWYTGLRWFVLFLPVGALLIWTLRFAEFKVKSGIWWKAPGTFFGIFLGVALAEEFFFRGMVLERLKQRWGTIAAVGVSSLAFGLVHLWFRDFPNWRFAVIAGVAGVFYGLAYLEARGIRAAMVTHALVATAWRTLFS